MASRIVIDGNAFYEIDEDCMRRKRARLEKQQREQRRKWEEEHQRKWQEDRQGQS